MVPEDPGPEQSADDGAVTLAAQELVVTVAGGKVLLDQVSFSMPEKCLVGVIGPSGAGKSTLLGAMTGMRPADAGTVVYDNKDLYEDYAELRHRIGLVPQENILHTQLTARRALQYSAELRFPTDTTAAERDARVTEVMEELGLAKHAQTRADRLSGGQLKRMNVAQELLTRPSLLFLDEPTSGLDPGLDKSIMFQLRDLAHDGRTIIVVTHSVLNLMVCDRLLILAPAEGRPFTGRRAKRSVTSGCPTGRTCSRHSTSTPTATGRASSPRPSSTRATRPPSTDRTRPSQLRGSRRWPRRRNVAAGCGSMPR
jgi:ABC-type cobalamin/Fe3+-siderophores transport system ATPase subunit